MRTRMHVLCVMGMFLLGLFQVHSAKAANLVQNGNFEQDEDADDIPDYWIKSGADDMDMELTLDVGRDGKGHSAKLTCDDFGSGSFPCSHSMIAQLNVVSIEEGKKYRLSFWAKGENIKGNSVKMGVANTSTWKFAWPGAAIEVEKKWKKYEITFESKLNIPSENSRLQFDYSSTGTLWLDDVELEETK